MELRFLINQKLGYISKFYIQARSNALGILTDDIEDIDGHEDPPLASPENTSFSPSQFSPRHEVDNVRFAEMERFEPSQAVDANLAYEIKKQDRSRTHELDIPENVPANSQIEPVRQIHAEDTVFEEKAPPNKISDINIVSNGPVKTIKPIWGLPPSGRFQTNSVEKSTGESTDESKQNGTEFDAAREIFEESLEECIRLENENQSASMSLDLTELESEPRRIVPKESTIKVNKSVELPTNIRLVADNFRLRIIEEEE